MKSLQYCWVFTFLFALTNNLQNILVIGQRENIFNEIKYQNLISIDTKMKGVKRFEPVDTPLNDKTILD